MIVLASGSKVLIAHRRLYEGDHGRFFVGVVDDYDDGLARVRGYTWMRDPFDGNFHKKEDLRTKIVPISSGSVIVYELPDSVDVDAFRIDLVKHKLIACDGGELEMDLSEGAIKGAA